MIFSRDYSRAVIPIKQGEGRFSAGRGIFGRAVVEIRGGRGSIMLCAQGVKNGSAGSLYMICGKGEELLALKAVLVSAKNGRADVKWDFNPDNILGSGYKLEDVRAAAVVSGDGGIVVSACFDGAVDFGSVKGLSSNEKPHKIEKPERYEKNENKEEAKFKAAEAAVVSEKENLSEKEENEPSAEKIQTEEEKRGEEREKKAENPKNRDFTEVVNHFRKDLDELRRYAYMENMERLDREKPKRKFRADVCGLFERRERAENKGLGECVKITPYDLCLIDEYMYKFGNNPTVLCSYIKYGYLLLGRNGEGLVFMIPDEKRELKQGERLGFSDFTETGEDFGLRAMNIKKC